MIDARERTSRFDTGSSCPVTKPTSSISPTSPCPISRFRLSPPRLQIGIFTSTASITPPSHTQPLTRRNVRKRDHLRIKYQGTCLLVSYVVTASLPLEIKSLVIERPTQIRTDCLGLPGFARLENLQELVASDGTNPVSGSFLIEFLPQKFNCSRRHNTARSCYHEFFLQPGHRQAGP